MFNKATDYLEAAVHCIEHRRHTRDDGDERAMVRTASIFAAATGVHLTLEECYLFMACLKVGRSLQGSFDEDDYIDGAAYIALAGEAAANKAVPEVQAGEVLRAPTEAE